MLCALTQTIIDYFRNGVTLRSLCLNAFQEQRQMSNWKSMYLRNYSRFSAIFTSFLSCVQMTFMIPIYRYYTCKLNGVPRRQTSIDCAEGFFIYLQYYYNPDCGGLNVTYSVEELGRYTKPLVKEILEKCDFSEIATPGHRTYLFTLFSIVFLSIWFVTASLLFVGAHRYSADRNALMFYTPWLAISVIIIILDVSQTIFCMFDIAHSRTRQEWMKYNGIKKIEDTKDWVYEIEDTSSQAVSQMLISAKGFAFLAMEITNVILVLLDLLGRCESLFS